MTAADTQGARAQPGFMERLGVRVLERRPRGTSTHAGSRASAAAAGDAVHLLTDTERAALRSLEYGAVARAAIAGGVSAGIAAGAEVLVAQHQDARPFFFWGVVGAAAIGATIAEILFVSWDSLRTVHAMHLAAGSDIDDDHERQEAWSRLAQAALEVPAPRDAEIGIDPLKETPRIRLLLAALAYKAKTGVTNVLFKIVLRRILGRSVLRAYVPFAAIPGTAFWTAWVVYRALKEARVRTFGPSLVDDVVTRLVPTDRELPQETRHALLRAVGACVVRTAEVHPNHARLLRRLKERLDVELPPDVDSSAAFLKRLASLNADDAALVRRTLRAAAVIDGRVVRRERALLEEAAASDGVDEAVGQMLRGVPIAV